MSSHLKQMETGRLNFPASTNNTIKKKRKERKMKNKKTERKSQKKIELSAKLKERLFNQWNRNPMGMTFNEFCECFK